MDAIIYRFALPSDVESLIRLRLAMQAEVGHGDASEAPQLEQALREYFTTALVNGDFLAYLGEVDGRIIAASGMVIHQHPPSGGNLSGREAYIMNMYTLPEFRRRGIGTELLRRLLDVARGKMCPRVILYALPQGKGIYLKEGFVSEPSGMHLPLQ